MTGGSFQKLHPGHSRGVGGAAPYRHHHGRQRALGAQAPDAARCRASRGVEAVRACGHRAAASNGRHRVSDAVRVQLRELATAAGRSLLPDAVCSSARCRRRSAPARERHASRVIGDLSRFDRLAGPDPRRRSNLTANTFAASTLTVAANYGGRWDIMQAVNACLAAHPEG
jgi:hypothetical protein